MHVLVSQYGLDVAAQRFGTLAEQMPSGPDPGHLADERRRLWAVMHRLDPLDREILELLAQGRSYREISEVLGIVKSAVTRRIPGTLARVRWWVECPELPEDDDLRAHLARCPELRRPPARWTVSYITGRSYRSIGRVEGRDHTVISRGVQQGLIAVTHTAHDCEVCRSVVGAARHRRTYRPPNRLRSRR